MKTNTKSERRAYEVVAERLAEQIKCGELADGAVLPSERELAEDFSVSRTTIREALLALQTAGLVSVRSRAKARVTKMKTPAFINQLSGAAQVLLGEPNGVENFQEARVLFECGLARYAASHASQKEIDKLNLALLRNKNAIGDAEEFARTDLAFHDVIASIPGNPIFTALNAALSVWLMDQRHVVIGSPVRDASQLAYDAHEQIYDAIASHDVEGAEQAMAAHLRDIAAIYRQAIA